MFILFEFGQKYKGFRTLWGKVRDHVQNFIMYYNVLYMFWELEQL